MIALCRVVECNLCRIDVYYRALGANMRCIGGKRPDNNVNWVYSPGRVQPDLERFDPRINWVIFSKTRSYQFNLPFYFQSVV